MRRRVLVVGGVIVVLVLLVVGGVVLQTLWAAGAFKRIEPHFAGQCRLVTGARGTEDLTIHPVTGIAYISASDRRARQAGTPVPGGIYAYDLNDPDRGLVNLTPDAGIDFQPHGLSLWRGEDGREVLYVVNHPPAGSGKAANTIEVFDLVDASLIHRRTITDERFLITPNDIVGVGEDQFYVTNTHAYPPGFAQTVETYLRRPGARVVFFDGERFRTAIPNLLFPNGINVSADGRSLYVAGTTARSVRVYDRDPETNVLTFRREIFIGTGLDNIEVAADGALWIGAHPKLLAVQRFRNDPSALSPSQVVRVDPNTGQWQEVFLDSGKLIPASSVAAVHGNRMLIGQILDDGILDCTLPAGS